MKYLNRSKIYEKAEPFKNAKKIYIFCEGDRESDYFKFFQGFSSNIDIIPIPNKNGESDPTKLKKQAEQMLTNNSISFSEELLDEIWFVIDTDRWNEKGKINELKQYVADKKTSYSGWFVAQSNPSFEIWLYFHFYAEKPSDVEIVAAKTFKEFVATKIKGGFDNRRMPLEIQQATLYTAARALRKNVKSISYYPET